VSPPLACISGISCLGLTQPYPYVSSYIQLYLLYPAVSHRISPPRKRGMTKNTLQGRAEVRAGIYKRFIPFAAVVH